MPTGRRSKRLQGEDPSAEKPAKRARKANSHTLAEFSKKQALVRQQNTGKRQGKRPRVPAQSPKKVLETPIPISSTPASPPSRVVDTTPVPKSKRAAAPPPSSPFNPSEEGKNPHYVSLIITPVMDGLRKESNGICYNLDINNVFRKSYEELQDVVYQKYVKNWEDIRKLKPSEKPRLSYWNVTIGNPKGRHHILRVDDVESWKDVEITLRQVEKDGGSDRKNAHKITIDAVYQSFDRSVTPPPEKPAKGKSKARPETVRLTRLDTSDSETGTIEDEDDYDTSDSQDLDQPPPLYKSRDSMTNRQLKEKRSRDKRLPAEEYNRKQLFAHHKCTRDGCENRSGACFYIKSKDSHHKLLPTELDEWAQLIGVDDITLKRPPQDWVLEYLKGYNEMKCKRKGKKDTDEKKDKVREEGTPTPTTTTTQPIDRPVHYVLPTQPVLPTYYHTQPQYPVQPQYPAHPPPPTYYDPQYNHWVAPPRLRRPPPPPPLPRPTIYSSPIREPIQEVHKGLEEYLLEKAQDEEERVIITRGLEVIRKHKIKVEQLKNNVAIQTLLDGGIRADIIMQIQDQAKEFKVIWQGHRAATEGLIKLQQSHSQSLGGGGSIASTYRQQMGSFGEDQTANYFDSY